MGASLFVVSLFVSHRYEFSTPPTARYQRIRHSTNSNGNPEVSIFSLESEGIEESEGDVWMDAQHSR